MGPLTFIERRKARALVGSFAPTWLAAGSAVSVLAASSVALSQTSPVLKLQWDAPSQCPQVDAVQSRIRELVGSTGVSPEQLRAEGRIIRSGDKFRLTLIVRSGAAAGVRELESDSCEHLTGAAAIGLGLLVRRARTATAPLTSETLGAPTESGDPSGERLSAEESHGAPPPSDVDAGGPPTSHDDKATTASAASLPSPTPAPALDTPASTRKLKVLLRAPSVEFGIGTLPGLTTGYALGAGAKYEEWQAFLTAGYWPRHTVESQWPQFGVDLTRYSVELDGCHAWRSRAFEWSPCLHAGFMNVVASGTGQGILSVRSTSSVWSAGATLDTKLHVTPWAAIFLAVGGEIKTSRPRFVNKEIGELYRFPSLGLKFGLGTEWLF